MAAFEPLVTINVTGDILVARVNQEPAEVMPPTEAVATMGGHLTCPHCGADLEHTCPTEGAET